MLKINFNYIDKTEQGEYNKYMNKYSYIQMKRVMNMENNNIEVCNCNIIHEDIVNKVRSIIPEEETLYDLADLFKVLGDSTRVRILCVLFEAEMCVCDIAALLGMTQSAISHQLRVLKQARLVKYKKNGKVVYYSLDDEHVKSIFDQGLIHISEKK